MQTHLLLREHPRALALRPTVLDQDPPVVLVFEPCDVPNKAVANLMSPSEFEDTQWKILNACPVFGCLGLIKVQGECFVAIVTDCVSVGRIRAGEEVYKISSVSFYSLTSNAYDDLDTTKDNWDTDEWDQQTTVVHPCAQLQKLFSIGNFYFTPDFDLTRTVQARSCPLSNMSFFDEHFLWNKFLVTGLLEFRSKLDRKKQMDLDRGGFLVFAIRGYVGVETVQLGSDKFKLSVISKLSWKRTGTRFNSRGIDDNGHVSNFVETETILYSDRVCYSFTQIRGSVPVFWEQQGMQLVNHRIQLAREAGASKPAVRRHFKELIDRYDAVCIVNLLSDKENTGESVLNNAYVSAVRQVDLPRSTIGILNFDLHAECRGGNYDNLALLMDSVRRYLHDYGYFFMDSEDNRVIFQQKGVFRTNCMDCLDRTNLVQNKISELALETYFSDGLSNTSRLGVLMERHAHLWAENGDSLSKIYAGTGALKSSFTRTGKVTFMNVLSDAAKSANRFYINNFQDKARQEMIDQLLGKLVEQESIGVYDPISDSVSNIVKKRIQEYSVNKRISIFCGTYNLNGKTFKGESLEPWLLQHFKWSDEEPDIYVVGFQEIVELSPQQVMATDTEKRKVWEQQIEYTLNSRKNAKAKYVPLRSNQLVGAALIIYVKDTIVEHIRHVETAIKKTGIMGIAGNKGAVAIRMEYGETSFCFVAAHLASGHSNVDDRNEDFHTINDGLAFPRGRKIENHENIVWISDLNYRVSLTYDEVHTYVEDGNIDVLLNNEQLIREMSQGKVFKNYNEGQITFLPTYKYDIGTNTYDTSEKQRVPGWTDRVLFKGESLRQLQYTRAELFTSDHRPVLALFEADVLFLDHEEKSRLQKEVYQQSVDNTDIPSQPVSRRKVRPPTPPLSRPSAPTVANLIDVSTNDEKYRLPPPSSDTSQWWNDGNPLPKADKSRAMLNRNPFESPSSVSVTTKISCQPPLV